MVSTIQYIDPFLWSLRRDEFVLLVMAGALRIMSASDGGPSPRSPSFAGSTGNVLNPNARGRLNSYDEAMPQSLSHADVFGAATHDQVLQAAEEAKMNLEKAVADKPDSAKADAAVDEAARLLQGDRLSLRQIHRASKLVNKTMAWSNRAKRRASIRKSVAFNGLVSLDEFVRHGEAQPDGRRLGRSSVDLNKLVLEQEKKSKLRKKWDKFYRKHFVRKRRSESLPKLMLLPDGRFRIGWDLSAAFLIVFYMIVVPLRMAFADTNIHNSFLAGRSDWYYVDFFSDIMFLVDIVLNFRTSFRRKNGELEKRSGVIAKEYMRMWFYIDCIASVPTSFIDTGDSAASKSNKLLRILRFFKLTKLFRVFKMGRIFRRLKSAVSLNPGIMRVVKMLTVLMVMWHFIACCYWGVSQVSGFCAWLGEGGDNSTSYNTFAPEFGDSDEKEMNGFQQCTSNADWVPWAGLKHEGILTQYTQALYWAVMVTTGIGRGTNGDEYIVCSTNSCCCYCCRHQPADKLRDRIHSSCYTVWCCHVRCVDWCIIQHTAEHGFQFSQTTTENGRSFSIYAATSSSEVLAE